MWRTSRNRASRRRVGRIECRVAGLAWGASRDRGRTVDMNDRLVQSQTVLGPSVDGLSPPWVQAAVVLWTFLVETRQEHKNHSFEVLGVLARWTRDRAREGLSTAFTASTLKAEVAPKTSKEPPENLQ